MNQSFKVLEKIAGDLEDCLIEGVKTILEMCAVECEGLPDDTTPDQVAEHFRQLKGEFRE